jgi:uncharacterized membrane protein YbhN (UPF0104 family)
VGLGFAAVFVMIALTPLFGALHRLALRVTRQSELHVGIGIGERFVILAASTVSMALLGMSFALFVIATTDAPASAMFSLIGICAAGYLAGYLVVFVPGGLGVREGVYAVLLALYIPASVAVAVAILARLWLTLVELVVVAFLVARYGTADLRAPAEPSRYTHG